MPTPRWMSQSTSEEFSWSQTLGGTRGIIEASAPGLVFVVVYVATHALLPTLVAASAVALLACAVRLIQRQGAGLYATLVGLPSTWRRDPQHAALRRRCGSLTWMWAGVFALRVAVQAPLWAAGAVAALGVAKLALGLPLFALGAWATWRGLRGYAPADSPSDSSESSDVGEATA